MSIATSMKVAIFCGLLVFFFGEFLPTAVTQKIDDQHAITEKLSPTYTKSETNDKDCDPALFKAFNPPSREPQDCRQFRLAVSDNHQKSHQADEQ